MLGRRAQQRARFVTRCEAPVEGRGLIAVVCTADVDDVDAALAAVRGLGGRVVQGARPVPGIGWHAYVEDTEGALPGPMQEHRSAA